MSSDNNVEVAPELQGERLTLRRAKGSLVGQLCFVLILSGCGLYLLFHGGRIPATICCMGVVVRAASVPAFWKQYRLVRSGAIAIVQPQITAQLARVHPAAAVVVTSLMTLMVLIMGAGTLYILPLASWSFIVKIIFAGFNLFLWLVTAFLWYRILTERRKDPMVEPVYEQGEGVWPPAPRFPKSD